MKDTFALPAPIGTPMEGGFLVGGILLPGGPYGIVKAPKVFELNDAQWGPRDLVRGALSFVDGRANTLAMAEAGSELARVILALRHDGKDDWYLSSLDETEVQYRNCKPGPTPNYMYMRSGINLHAIPPTHPYTADDPKQTAVEIFRKGGSECFEEDAVYWTSTQSAYASGYASGYAWSQYFNYGNQFHWHKDNRCRGCPVRRFKI